MCLERSIGRAWLAFISANFAADASKIGFDDSDITANSHGPLPAGDSDGPDDARRGTERIPRLGREARQDSILRLLSRVFPRYSARGSLVYPTTIGTMS